MWVLGDAQSAVVTYASALFDKVERIAVADLAGLEDGYVIFTEEKYSIANVQSVLGKRRLPFIKVGTWQSRDKYDAEWISLPSESELLLLNEKIARESKIRVKFADASKIDVQRFLPYATISFLCLAVVAIWYAIYFPDTAPEADELAVAEVVDVIEEADAVTEIESATIKCSWQVPKYEVAAPIDGELVWDAANRAVVGEHSAIASIALNPNPQLVVAAQEFKSKLEQRAAATQNQLRANLQLQKLAIQDLHRRCDDEILILEARLDDLSQQVRQLRADARGGLRSWTEISSFVDELQQAESLHQQKLAERREYAQQLLDFEKNNYEYGNDEMYQAQIEFAEQFANLTAQSHFDFPVSTPFSGQILRKVPSYSMVNKGDPIANIRDTDGAYFEGSVRESEHQDWFRHAKYFLMFENGERYGVDLHSETFNNGVFEYVFKVDMVRFSELSDDLRDNLFYDIILEFE